MVLGDDEGLRMAAASLPDQMFLDGEGKKLSRSSLYRQFRRSDLAKGLAMIFAGLLIFLVPEGFLFILVSILLLAATEQTVYNMLSVDGNRNYYKLRSGTITAPPLDKQSNGSVDKGKYILTDYDFTNVVITIDGVDYKYNDGSLDEYENYFTVVFDEVQKVNTFNRDGNYFKNRDTWLDGSFEEYGTLPNNTTAYHANYNATTHKAVERPRSVTIASDWPEGVIAYPGAKITMTATLEGFVGDYTLQWQFSTDKEHWNDIDGANALTYTYTLDETTATYYWRIVADDKK